MSDRTLSHLTCFLLFVSISFNMKMSESPPLFLSNVILFFIDTLLLFKIISHFKSDFFTDVKQVLLLFLVISTIALLSYNNKNMISVFPKLVLGLYTYYAFSRYFYIDSRYSLLPLLGLCLGTALSPFFQIKIEDLTTMSTTNRIKVDNLGNFNAYAFLISLSIVISTYLVSKIKTNLNKLLLIITQIPLLIVLLLTFSRGGAFALLIGMLLYLFSINKKAQIYLLLFFGIGIIIIGYTMIQLDSIDAFMNRFLNTENDENFDSGRSLIYVLLLNNLFSSIASCLLGFGIGAIDVDMFTESNLISAHNTYLDVFYSCGVIGLIFFVRYLFKTYKSIQQLPKSNEKSICIALLGQITFCFFYDSYWGATQIGWIFPFVFAFLYSQIKISNVTSSYGN